MADSHAATEDARLARYLVTGGAGYVGSHVVAALLERGDDVVVIDNLSQGHRAAVLAPARLVVGELADRAVLAGLFDGPRFDAVLHFASLSQVEESMRLPLRYFIENCGPAFLLAELALQAGCRRFVLSSTANLFADATGGAIAEDAPAAPSSPYGHSKRMIEEGLIWAAAAQGLDFTTLRYFNAAGADAAGRLGEDHRPETHLIPLAIDAALGRRPPLTIFGTDYPTPDGTCVRDYVHVEDLAAAHLAVLDLPGRAPCYSVGSGQGWSVRQVMDSVHRISGLAVPHAAGPRRSGDPAMLVASVGRLRAEAGWAPRLSTLDRMVADAFAWRSTHPDGYGDRG